jgi:glycosyltransferase 2 family protein
MNIRTAMVTLLAIALFAWFISRANLSAVATEIRRARVDLIVWSVVISVVLPVVRALRWRYLLDPIGQTRFGPLLKATILGFAALAFLPARAGDVLRPYLVARSERLNVASVMATVVMERALDLIAVLTLLAAFVWVFDGRTILPPALLAPIEASATVAAAIVIGLMVVMWTLATHPERIGRLVMRSDRLLPARMAHALSNLARTFSEGFAVARKPRDLAIAFVWSFPLWFSIAFQAWLITRAFGILIPVSASFLVQAMLVIGVAMPTPGAVGSFHEAYRIAATSFFGAPNSAAVSAALVLHAVSFLTSLLPGAVIMAMDGLSLSGLGQLAGVARREEAVATDEVSVLRPSGR